MCYFLKILFLSTQTSKQFLERSLSNVTLYFPVLLKVIALIVQSPLIDFSEFRTIFNAPQPTIPMAIHSSIIFFRMSSLLFSFAKVYPFFCRYVI